MVFGKTSGAIVELSDIDGTNNAGFVLNGGNGNDQSGGSVSGAGDVNGDGLDDLIIGAFGADLNGNNSNDNRGASYVVFGKSDGSVVELSVIADADANNNAGFVINGVTSTLTLAVVRSAAPAMSTAMVWTILLSGLTKPNPNGDGIDIIAVPAMWCSGSVMGA